MNLNPSQLIYLFIAALPWLLLATVLLLSFITPCHWRWLALTTTALAALIGLIFSDRDGAIMLMALTASDLFIAAIFAYVIAGDQMRRWPERRLYGTKR